GVRRPDPALCPDRRESGPRTTESEEPMEIEIAFDFVAELLDLDALGGRVVGVTDRVAEGEGLEDELNSVRTRVRAEEDRRLVADQLEGLRTLRGGGPSVLELADLAFVAAPALPRAAGAEGELRGVGVGLHGPDGSDKTVDIDSVAVGHGGHRLPPAGGPALLMSRWQMTPPTREVIPESSAGIFKALIVVRDGEAGLAQ